MATKFSFSYLTDNDLYKGTSAIYAESLYFAVKRFKDTHNEDCTIIGVQGTIETEMGIFNIVGLTI